MKVQAYLLDSNSCLLCPCMLTVPYGDPYREHADHFPAILIVLLCTCKVGEG